jgi:hypothetical protein
MTRKQAYWMSGIGVGAALVLLLVHLLVLPIDASWTVNRVLHHVWEVLAVLAGGGGVVWALWPRPKARKRNVERERVRRRAIAVIAVALAAVTLVVTAEMLRDLRARTWLDEAGRDLNAIHETAAAWRQDHGGEWPESLDALDLPAEVRHFPYRHGPDAADPPADSQPSYTLVRPPRPGEPERETPILAYLKPGSTWAPLTMVVEKRGTLRVVGEDAVKPLERIGERPPEETGPATESEQETPEK